MNRKKTWFKFFTGMIVLALVALGLFSCSVNSSSQAKSNMIEQLAKIPPGTNVDDVIKIALNLGFNFDVKEFAIPNVVQMKDEDSPLGRNGVSQKVSKSTDLSKFKNGILSFGFSLFLFNRKGCEITFKDGVVTNTRIWELD